MGLLSSAFLTLSLCLRGLLLLTICVFVVSCGGSSDSQSRTSNKVNFSSSSVATSTSSVPLSVSSTSAASSFSSLLPMVPITGRITYDFVPHTGNGLNYGATAIYPARGVVVELLDENNRIVASSITDTDGNYLLEAIEKKLVKVRAKAQLLRQQSPGWNFKVTDNTNNNSLYSMSGNLLEASAANGVRNLHAPSGWTGAGYTESRTAAPFAILDSVYVGIERIQSSGNLVDFPALELRWSTKNKAAEGQLSLGEIGTSFYRDDAVYILGDENNDTDEYDRHVILHEWAHYIESAFSRSDNFGGDHTIDDKLDMRIAMSEGFSNAFSAIMLEDSGYRDSNGGAQAKGFSFDVSKKNNYSRGWYSEASVQSVIYNFYSSAAGSKARNFADIFQLISTRNYTEFNGFMSIYVFAEQLRKNMPAHADLLNNLLTEQNIEITDEYGAGESNSGGNSKSLPVYKNFPATGLLVNACSTNNFGTYNKLANAQYFSVSVAAPGTYQFTAQESADSGDSNPELYLYQYGVLVGFAERSDIDTESFSQFLDAGTYTLELVDARVADVDESAQITACFDLRAQLIN